jgi:hypothetical protein
MQKLLQGLKADGSGGKNKFRLGSGDENDDDEEEDEDIRKIMSRKVSMNEQNVVGTNFEKYNNHKPS